MPYPWPWRYSVIVDKNARSLFRRVGMASGNSVTYLRLLSQLRDYVVRATPASLIFQRDLPDLVKKISASVYTNKEVIEHTNQEVIEHTKVEKTEKQTPSAVAAATPPSIDARTRYLTKSLSKQLTEGGCLKKLRDLASHLKHHPQAKGVAVKSGGIRQILKIVEQGSSGSGSVECEARECLALLGYTHPVKAHGIRLLTIDGGGIR
ncbi:Calcium-independent phospholipase A2-gamma [Chionoecetes opilio]|uniref:Calcium-independent phospholipase A2-gamma n=1 Tax=Chionoecetes opilio TaxID=41210 RepID=A0A8J4XZI1_CHIOP|nr:Calcium-independent phospholipase A2-gamma [Chionoecetes opilio]